MFARYRAPDGKIRYNGDEKSQSCHHQQRMYLLVQVGSFDDQPSPPLPAQAAPTGVPIPLAPGVWRLPLPVPFSLGSVNCYVLHGEGQWALVDCGLGTHASNGALREGLAALGIDFGDLSALVLTHAHPDHIAPAGDIAAQMPPDGRVFVLDHELDRYLHFWAPGELAGFELLARAQMLGGLTRDEAELGLQSMRSMGRLIHLPEPRRVATLVADAPFDIAGRCWRVLWTPGHARGHLCLAHANLVITGDHILPLVSPNVSYSDPTWADPIQDHLDSLAAVAALDIPEPLVLPGHGAEFAALAERCAALRASHTRRSMHALHALQAQPEPATALTITETIFRGRIHGPEDRWLALGETLAHLEHLRSQGMATRTERDGVARYLAASEVPGDFAP
jgi:glyoxylase-like metal-dependent hydrolase (beta-lactamase superfamily II)